jgi:hypothetical protein
MDPKGKGMVVNDKEKESLFNEPRDDKPTDLGSSHKKRDGKKKRRIKKIIYYDSDASSSSPRDDDDEGFRLLFIRLRRRRIGCLGLRQVFILPQQTPYVSYG